MKTVVIAVHSYSYGTAQAFRDYLKRCGDCVLFIETPLFSSIWIWLLGFFGTIGKVMFSRQKYDYYLGANNLNALAGLILKKLGFVDKVIYFFLDYTEKRFDNRFLNYLYWRLDRYCLIHCNIAWNSSSYDKDFHREMRLLCALPPKYVSKQIPIPEGTVELPFNPTPSKSIVWVGHLKKGMGLEIMVDAFNEVWKDYPAWTLFILGKGNLKRALEDRIWSDIQIYDVDLPDGYSVLLNCSIGLAPYEPGTISIYTDPGKVKNYLSAGLAIILTKTVLIWKEIEQKGAGIAINYNKEELKQAIITLIKQQYLLQKMRCNSYMLGREYRWDKIFERGLA